MALNRILGLVGCLTLALVACIHAAAEPETYTVRVAVYRLESDISEAMPGLVTNEHGSFVVDSGLSDEGILDALAAYVRDEQKKVQEGKQEKPAIALVANPTMVTKDGQDAQLAIETEIRAVYLEPAKCGEDTHFARRTFSAPVGIRVDAKVTSTDDPEHVQLKLGYHSLSVGEREEIPGLGSSLGKPSVIDDAVLSTTRVRRGDWVGLHREVPGDGYILLLAQVLGAEEDAEQKTSTESSADASTTQPLRDAASIVYAVDSCVLRLDSKEAQSVLDALEISPNEAPTHGGVNVFRTVSACPEGSYDAVKEWLESQESTDVLAAPRATIPYDPPRAMPEEAVPGPGTGLDAHLTPAFRTFLAGTRERTCYILHGVSRTPRIAHDSVEQVITGGNLMGIRLSTADEPQALNIELAFEHRDLDTSETPVKNKPRKSHQEMNVSQDAFRITVPCRIGGWVGFSYRESGRDSHMVILANVKQVPGTVEFVKPAE